MGSIISTRSTASSSSSTSSSSAPSPSCLPSIAQHSHIRTSPLLIWETGNGIPHCFTLKAYFHIHILFPCAPCPVIGQRWIELSPYILVILSPGGLWIRTSPPGAFTINYRFCSFSRESGRRRRTPLGRIFPDKHQEDLEPLLFKQEPCDLWNESAMRFRMMLSIILSQTKTNWRQKHKNTPVPRCLVTEYSLNHLKTMDVFLISFKLFPSLMEPSVVTLTPQVVMFFLINNKQQHHKVEIVQ